MKVGATLIIDGESSCMFRIMSHACLWSSGPILERSATTPCIQGSSGCPRKPAPCADNASQSPYISTTRTNQLFLMDGASCLVSWIRCVRWSKTPYIMFDNHAQGGQRCCSEVSVALQNVESSCAKNPVSMLGGSSTEAYEGSSGDGDDGQHNCL